MRLAQRAFSLQLWTHQGRRYRSNALATPTPTYAPPCPCVSFLFCSLSVFSTACSVFFLVLRSPDRRAPATPSSSPPYHSLFSLLRGACACACSSSLPSLSLSARGCCSFFPPFSSCLRLLSCVRAWVRVLVLALLKRVKAGLRLHATLTHYPLLHLILILSACCTRKCCRGGRSAASHLPHPSTRIRVFLDVRAACLFLLIVRTVVPLLRFFLPIVTAP